MSVAVTHARLGACLLMSPDQCKTLAGSVPFVSNGLVVDASLTSVPCFYNAKQFLFQKAFLIHAGLVCWSLAASRS